MFGLGPSIRSGRLAKPQSHRKAFRYCFVVNMVLEFLNWRLSSLLGSGILVGSWSGGFEGYFATLGRRILDSAVKVSTLGLRNMSEVVFHRRLVGGSFGGMVKGCCLPGTGEWTCSNCGKTDCWSTRYSCYRVWSSSVLRWEWRGARTFWCWSR